VEVLFEERGKLPGQWFGRTRGNHGVIIEVPQDLLGQMRQVRITRATARTLFGELSEQPLPQECRHAA
jgi:tRNA A37 methylthiotransferase MiaB